MENLVQCPYNFSHMIQKTRLGRHLVKCRRQHPLADFSICPYNTNHDVPTPEIQYHMENCEDKFKLESSQQVVKKPAEKTKAEPVPLPQTNENWDEDPPTCSYLEAKGKRMEDRFVLRAPVGMTKAQKKEFYNQEIEKFQKISDETDEPDAQNTLSKSADSQDSIYCKSPFDLQNFQILFHQDTSDIDTDCISESPSCNSSVEESNDDGFQLVCKKSRGRGITEFNL